MFWRDCDNKRYENIPFLLPMEIQTAFAWIQIAMKQNSAHARINSLHPLLNCSYIWIKCNIQWTTFSYTVKYLLQIKPCRLGMLIGIWLRDLHKVQYISKFHVSPSAIHPGYNMINRWYWLCGQGLTKW